MTQLSTTLRRGRPHSLSTLFSSKNTPHICPPLLTQKPTFPKHPYHNQKLQKHHHLTTLISTCTSNTHLHQIHTQLIKLNLLHSLSLLFLSKASTFSPFSYLNTLFSQIQQPNLYFVNTILKGLSRSENPRNGFEFYVKMMRGGRVKPDPHTMSFCLKCCIKGGLVREGEMVHKGVLVGGWVRDGVLMTCLMEVYTSGGRCWDAVKVFGEMAVRDTVACNVVISCLVKSKRRKDALLVFETMKKLEICRPDDVTCLLLVQTCGELGALEFGRRVRKYAEKARVGKSRKFRNALVTMFSKCGCVEEAYEVFKEISGKNLVSWSSMLSGFAMNGYGEEAIEMFMEMERRGLEFDDVVFTGVLYACSHSGLIAEGLEFYDRMIEEFKVVPNIHHCGCMVDLLCRAGFLNRAYEYILAMKVKPDAKIWRTLLAACRMYRSFDLAERVIEHIVELKAEEAGDYVLLLNAYSSNGKWDKVCELKKFMKENGIRTTAGCSTTILGDVVHEFNADDMSHPLKDEIYEKLRDIRQQLKIAGYVPETSSELHNLYSEEQETALSHHTEKLAMAFVVLATPPGTTIRVASNLRTCSDCHNFAKFLSGVYNRKVILRDRDTLHHIRGGQCSCGDYW